MRAISPAHVDQSQILQILQSDVARSVAGSLTLTLLPAEQTRLASASPVNPEAYEAYLKGHFHAQKETPADLDLALEYFQVVLQKDPTYAPAYAGIAFVWTARNQPRALPLISRELASMCQSPWLVASFSWRAPRA